MGREPSSSSPFDFGEEKRGRDGCLAALLEERGKAGGRPRRKRRRRRSGRTRVSPLSYSSLPSLSTSIRNPRKKKKEEAERGISRPSDLLPLDQARERRSSGLTGLNRPTMFGRAHHRRGGGPRGLVKRAALVKKEGRKERGCAGLTRVNTSDAQGNE